MNDAANKLSSIGRKTSNLMKNDNTASGKAAVAIISSVAQLASKLPAVKAVINNEAFYFSKDKLN